MPLHNESIRTLFESEGPKGFVQKTRQLLGITTDEYGRPIIKDAQMRPEEFSLRQLAESLLGERWPDALDPGRSDGRGLDLLEDATAAVPSSFQNTNAWNATVGGLIEVKILEMYRRPGYVADRVTRTIPTRQRSEKMPGVGGIGDKGLEMRPSDPHPRAQFDERWVTTPETAKHGMAIDVSREAVHFDLTNQVLAQAEKVGDWLGLEKEKRVLDTFLGVTNTYTYNGTAYNTYLTAGNWINEISEVLTDWTDIDQAYELFSDMTDIETGERIVVVPTQLLVMPKKKLQARRILNATEVRSGDITSGTGDQLVSTNPIQEDIELLSSPIAHQQLVASGVSNADADDYWYFGNFQRAFGYMENWGMQVRRADPNDYTMIDRDLVFSVFANEMGAPAVLEPREVMRGIQS